MIFLLFFIFRLSALFSFLSGLTQSETNNDFFELKNKKLIWNTKYTSGLFFYFFYFYKFLFNLFTKVISDI